MFRLSFARGADIQAADTNSYTPIMTAAANGQVNAFIALRERGARIDVLDRYGKSVAFLAAEGDHDSILNVSWKVTPPLCGWGERERRREGEREIRV